MNAVTFDVERLIRPCLRKDLQMAIASSLQRLRLSEHRAIYKRLASALFKLRRAGQADSPELGGVTLRETLPSRPSGGAPRRHLARLKTGPKELLSTLMKRNPESRH